MQAVITAAFIENIPAPIRQRLHLKVGEVLDFDETTPFLKAVPAEKRDGEDLREFQTWLSESTGIAKGKFTTDERMHQTRGED